MKDDTLPEYGSEKYYQVKRVFFHELGHFVANELNRKYYNGTGTKEISIYPCDRFPNEYCGGTTPNLPDGYSLEDDTTLPLSRLSQNLAGNNYGCLFQSYYLGCEFNTCIKNHGFDDNDRIDSILMHHKLNVLHEIYQLRILYFNKLVSGKCLDQFVNLDLLNYIFTNKEGVYMINIELLSADTSKMLDDHYKIYKGFIEDIQEIINLGLKTNNF